jgi:hypothetical protein
MISYLTWNEQNPLAISLMGSQMLFSQESRNTSEVTHIIHKVCILKSLPYPMYHEYEMSDRNLYIHKSELCVK